MYTQQRGSGHSHRHMQIQTQLTENVKKNSKFQCIVLTAYHANSKDTITCTFALDLSFNENPSPVLQEHLLHFIRQVHGRGSVYKSRIMVTESRAKDVKNHPGDRYGLSEGILAKTA